MAAAHAPELRFDFEFQGATATSTRERSADRDAPAPRGPGRLRPDRRKRAEALGRDTLVGCFDLDAGAAEALARQFGGRACASIDELLDMEPDAAVVAMTHDALAESAMRGASGGRARARREAGGDRGRRRRSDRRGGRSARGAASRSASTIASTRPSRARLPRRGRGGSVAILHLRARYGHGGRPGYENEWRAHPRASRAAASCRPGHAPLDLSHGCSAPLPLHSALLRTAFWPMRRWRTTPSSSWAIAATGPWALFHVSWTEWKNLFSLEIYCRRRSCRSTASPAPTARSGSRIYADETGARAARRRGARRSPPRMSRGVASGCEFSGRDLRRRRPSVCGGPRLGSIRLGMHRGCVRAQRSGKIHA